MELIIDKKPGVDIAPGMIGLFFEDINYAADGGLYAEMLENRSFEFFEAEGEAKDYYVRYDGAYAWEPYAGPQGKGTGAAETVGMRVVMGSPHTTENPHYMRLTAHAPMCGILNRAYDGICLRKGMQYYITFWARCVKFDGKFCVDVIPGRKEQECKADRESCAPGFIAASAGTEETYNYFRKYTLTVTAAKDLTGGRFVLCLDAPGIVELDYVSMFPADAAAGLFRKDLFEKLRDLQPGFLRFPGGCVIEGNTLENRYRYKDTLKEPWARKNNWNRWAVHGNNEKNHYHSPYSHYNQTLGLGFYEYFLLCEMIGARPIPVLNVGLACQYQSEEQVSTDAPEFQEFLQDAVDLIEFANGGTDTKWGSVRARMGHPKPFGLNMLGIGNEQWETDRADFFRRYELFERTIHACAPKIRLIGSAGPDITSDRYTNAWQFYYAHEEQENFVYAVDEHYYVKPQWLLAHTDFYDEYSRKIKVFSGEYAAHPMSGMNLPQANTLEGALAEAAFLTGAERNADVVVLASYAPLFARAGYAQWSPDMIWFDARQSCCTPSYYVQKMYAGNMGNRTIECREAAKEAAKRGIYYSLSVREKAEGTERTEELILKIVNFNDRECPLNLSFAGPWSKKIQKTGEQMDKRISGKADLTYRAEILTGEDLNAFNSFKQPEKIAPYQISGLLSEGITLPAYSFAVVVLSLK